MITQRRRVHRGSLRRSAADRRTGRPDRENVSLPPGPMPREIEEHEKSKSAPFAKTAKGCGTQDLLRGSVGVVAKAVPPVLLLFRYLVYVR